MRRCLMAEDSTLFGVRIGRPDPLETRAIHRARQANLPEDARAEDPSSLARVVDREQLRDQIARARNAWRVGELDE